MSASLLILGQRSENVPDSVLGFIDPSIIVSIGNLKLAIEAHFCYISIKEIASRPTP